MIAYFANLLGFGKAPDPQYNSEGKRIPVAGEKCWRLDNSDGSPFPPKKRYDAVKILEVRDGWVRYALSSTIFNNERSTIDSFTRAYRADEVKK